MIVVTIGGVDRTSLITDITITDSVNNRVDTADFTIEKTPLDSYTPALNAEIIVTRGTDRIFGGVITSISDELVGVNTIRYSVSCVDYTFFFNRSLLVERFENMTINAIIASLVATYAPTFTTVAVVAPINVASIAFNRITMSDALKKLADLVNYQWYVDYNKDVHFFAADTVPAPFNIVDGNYIRESLKVTRDISQLRNRVLIQGGDVPGATSTVKLAGNGETAQFDTKYEFATLPTVTVDGWAQTVGNEYTDTDDSLFDCMWSFQQKYLRFTAGNIPPAPTGPATTNIEITGNPLLPIVVDVPDEVSIAAFGEYQFALTDTNIVSEDQAIERALAELKANAAALSEGTVDTYKYGLRSGQIVRFTDALRGLDEDFVIQKVQYRYLSTDATYDGLWSVTAATLKTVGIIAILQKLLLKEELTIDERLSLIKFLRIPRDTLAVSDALAAVTTNTGPFVWSFISNGSFESQPPFTAATTTFDRWIDGTAGGSTTNDNWRWAATNTSGSNLAAKFDTVAGFPCMKMTVTNVVRSGSGASTSQSIISPILSYTGGSVSPTILAKACPVTAGNSYTISGDYYLEAISDGTKVFSQLNGTWYNAAGTRLTSFSVAVNPATLNTWTALANTQTAPAGAAFLVLTARVVAGGSTDFTGGSATINWKNLNVVEAGKTPITWGFFTWA